MVSTTIFNFVLILISVSDLIKSLHKEGKIAMAGPLTNPVDGAVIVFDCDTDSDVEEFVAKDPYKKHGLVSSYSIREWSVVVG